jgi:hypothetical protein
VSDATLEDLIALAERSFVRMQAQELIGHFLEEEDLEPFDQLVESLILAGTNSLAALGDIIEEIRAKRSSLSLEAMNLRQKLMEALAEIGIHMPQLPSSDAAEALKHIRKLALSKDARKNLRDMGCKDEQVLQEICGDAGNHGEKISRKLVMLRDIEDSVLDWFECLTYEAARAIEYEPGKDSHPTIH